MNDQQKNLKIEQFPGSDTQGYFSPVLTVEEVAALLRVNRKTVYDLFNKGELPGGRRVGRCIRFSRDAVVMWLAGNHAASHRMRNKS